MPARTCALHVSHATTGATILNESPIPPFVHRSVPAEESMNGG